MMSLTFALFTQVSGSGPLGPLVQIWPFVKGQIDVFTCISCMKLSYEIEFPHAGVC